MSSTNRPGGQRVDLDFYASPRWTVDLIVPHLGPLAGKRILEPEAGRGAIVKALLARGADPANVYAIEIDPGRAAVCQTMLPSGHVLCADYMIQTPDAIDAFCGVPDLVVKNPPFADAEAHIAKSVGLLDLGGTCAALVRLPFAVCGQNRRAFRQKHPCDLYPLTRRPSFTAEIIEWATDDELRAMAIVRKIRHDGREETRLETIVDVKARLRGSDSTDYAWALYGEGHGGRFAVLEDGP